MKKFLLLGALALGLSSCGLVGTVGVLALQGFDKPLQQVAGVLGLLGCSHTGRAGLVGGVHQQSPVTGSRGSSPPTFSQTQSRPCSK